VLAATTSELTVGHRLLPHPGYPWTLEARITYRLGGDGLAVRTEVVNVSSEPAPFGLGFHPYLSAGGGLVDGCTLTVPAATAYDADERGLPTGTHDVVGTGDDFRSGRVVGDRHLDLTLTDLGRGGDGRAVLDFAHPDGPTTRLWVDEGFGHLQVFSGDTLGDVARRRRGLAVEPMTGPANLLASGTGRVTLEPGQPFVATWGLVP
jgi:aldose 1-epimerase